MSIPEQIGRFEVQDRLGEGGFAEVFLARDPWLGGQVAVKVLKTKPTRDPEMRSRFQQEARTLRHAEFDRVVRLYDVGELPDGRPYLVMSYANAGTLEDRLRPGATGRLPAALVLRYGAEIARGVASLHRAGTAHRDIKPSNVLFHTSASGDESLLIADLGLAKNLADSRGYTRGVGTDGYMMAPEQLLGVDITERVDIYSIGAVVYRALTGQLPRTGQPVPPSQLRPGLPRLVDDLLLRALAVEPQDRWDSAEDLAEALDRLAAEVGTTRNGRRYAAAGVALALVVAGAAVTVALNRTDATPRPVTKPDPSTSASSVTPGRSFKSVDGDGDADLVGVVGTRLGMYPGKGNSTFDRWREIGNGWSTRFDRIAVGDADGDRRADLFATTTDGELLFYQNRGVGYGVSRPVGHLWHKKRWFALADADGDRRADLLALRGASLLLYHGKGDGEFRSATVLSGGWSRYVQIMAGDVNQDGRADLLATDKDGVLSYAKNTGSAGSAGSDDVSYSKPGRVSDGWSIEWQTTAADFDGDRRVDLVTVSDDGTLRYHQGIGDGHFGKGVKVGQAWDTMRLASF